MFVRYMLSIKQYHLYKPKIRTLVKSRDVVFYEDTPFFLNTAEQIFMPTTKDPSRREGSPGERKTATYRPYHEE